VDHGVDAIVQRRCSVGASLARPVGARRATLCDKSPGVRPPSAYSKRRTGEDEPPHRLRFSLPQSDPGVATLVVMTGSVLVVDDDPGFRRLAQRLLTSFGLTVAGEADTAAAAIAAVGTLRPDAALVDVGLPDADGISLARQLTALPWRPRVVLTSTDAGAVTDEDVRDSGAEAFVPKEQLPDASLAHLLGPRRP
jgi:CheY-like chemotaxis protein